MAELTTLLVALGAANFSLPSLDPWTLPSPPTIVPALVLLCSVGLLASAPVRRFLAFLSRTIKPNPPVHTALLSLLSTLILLTLLSLRRHPLVLLGLQAVLLPTPRQRIHLAFLLTPFVRLDAALRPLAGAFDALLPRPPHAPPAPASLAPASTHDPAWVAAAAATAALWTWWRPVRTLTHQAVICGAVFAHDCIFGTEILPHALKQAERGLAVACGALVGDAYFEAIHLAFGAIVAVERIPPEGVLELAKYVVVGVELIAADFGVGAVSASDSGFSVNGTNVTRGADT